MPGTQPTPVWEFNALCDRGVLQRIAELIIIPFDSSLPSCARARLPSHLAGPCWTTRLEVGWSNSALRFVRAYGPRISRLGISNSMGNSMLTIDTSWSTSWRISPGTISPLAVPAPSVSFNRALRARSHACSHAPCLRQLRQERFYQPSRHSRPPVSVWCVRVCLCPPRCVSTRPVVVLAGVV